MLETEYEQNLKPAPRRAAWICARLLFCEIERGNLRRLPDLFKRAYYAHLNTEERMDVQEIYLVNLHPRIAGILFESIMVETVWDLSQVRRSEVIGVANMGPMYLAWCDDLLHKHGLAWMPEKE